MYELESLKSTLPGYLKNLFLKEEIESSIFYSTKQQQNIKKVKLDMCIFTIREGTGH